MTDTLTDVEVAVINWSTEEAAAHFANAALFASSDTSRPVLSMVQVNLDGGKVQLVSTDSYALAIIDATAAEHANSGGTSSHLIPAKAFAEVAKAAKAAKAGTVQLTITGRSFTFLVHSMKGDQTISGDVFPAEFPNWQGVVPAESGGIDPQSFAFGLNQLARLGKVVLVDPPKKNKYMTAAPTVEAKWVVCHPSKPSIVTIGSDVRIVLMPCRTR